ncbi:MAG: hypothetical protein NVS3B12_16410 [Acidimicrobiales bacterium]
MTELIDVRADAIGPGERICLGGCAILVTAVECGTTTVDLHTEYGPSLRLLRRDCVALILAHDAAGDVAHDDVMDAA